MHNHVVFSTSNYTYMYSFHHQDYIFIHPILKYIIENGEQNSSVTSNHFINDPSLRAYSEEQILHYWNKYLFLKEKQFIQQNKQPEFGKLHRNMIKQQVENLNVLTFEVTDKCNLRCRYCTYGDMYSGYDSRIGNDLDFGRAKQLLDYLFNIWRQSASLTYQRNIVIGFYGGEPLMNMDIIQKIVKYTSSYPLENIAFSYNMTTNAMLLNRYADFLVKHQFNLLVSLDGDREADTNRITVNGKESFSKVFTNIKQLQTNYPDYFEAHVSFNSVYHAGSDIDKILDFFKREFNKTTSLSELNNSSIADQSKFDKMHKSVYRSIASSPQSKVIDQELMYESPRISILTYFLHHLTSEVFKDYRIMFYDNKKYALLPGGTCIPFNRKMFLTVNGRILPCERIDHDFSIGYVDKNHVELDFEKIADTYNGYYDKITKQCCECYMFKSCSQCLFYTDVKPDKIVCHGFKNKELFADYLTLNIGYLEDNPWAYNRVMKEITIL